MEGQPLDEAARGPCCPGPEMLWWHGGSETRLVLEGDWQQWPGNLLEKLCGEGTGPRAQLARAWKPVGAVLLLMVEF